MAKVKFKEIQMSRSSKASLGLINSIIDDYSRDGYTLTLRQLYYQLVSRDVIPNNDKQYKKLSRILKEGRLAGIVDWEAIEDRLRKVSKVTTWNTPKQILETAKRQFTLDRLQDQETYLEVWVEKDALSQVVERAASQYQVPVLVNRGYGSVSAIFETYKRFSNELSHDKKKAIILYLGDHDPSGLDMVRDIRERLSFMLQRDGFQYLVEVQHIALTKEQIQQYSPPPNPAKLSDTRAKKYIKEHGAVSWEVDALEPRVLNQLIVDEILSIIDIDKYEKWKELEKQQKSQIEKFISEF